VHNAHLCYTDSLQNNRPNGIKHNLPVTLSVTVSSPTSIINNVPQNRSITVYYRYIEHYHPALEPMGTLPAVWRRVQSYVGELLLYSTTNPQKNIHFMAEIQLPIRHGMQTDVATGNLTALAADS